MTQSTKSIPASELAKTYHEILKGPDGKSGRDYLESRGIDIDFAIYNFTLGFANEGYFKNRIIFPVFSTYNTIETLTSRTIDPTEKKKHIHTAGTRMDWLYNERVVHDLCFNAWGDSVVILCESPIDAITLEQKGWRAVAAMGANNMNKGKCYKLRNFDKAYICFDNDINESGQKAADRVGRMLTEHKEQEVFNLHIPFLLGSDINSMFMSDRKNFIGNFRELISESVKILPVIHNRRVYKESIGPLITKYPILDTIERYVDHLIPCGAGRYKTICPFHEETEASFHVDEIKNRFKCFGCSKSGDTIDFLMFIHERMGRRLGFKDALVILDAQVP